MTACLEDGTNFLKDILQIIYELMNNISFKLEINDSFIRKGFRNPYRHLSCTDKDVKIG